SRSRWRRTVRQMVSGAALDHGMRCTRCRTCVRTREFCRRRPAGWREAGGSGRRTTQLSRRTERFAVTSSPPPRKQGGIVPSSDLDDPEATFPRSRNESPPWPQDERHRLLTLRPRLGGKGSKTSPCEALAG